MPIRFHCPKCDRALSIARRKAGTQVRCPRCAADVTVPAASEDPSEPNVEPVDLPVPPPPPKAPPKPAPVAARAAVRAARPRPDDRPLFEREDVDELLARAVSKPPEPTRAGPVPPAPPLPPADDGIVISRGGAVVLGVVTLVLLGLAFATGFLVGR